MSRLPLRRLSSGPAMLGVVNVAVVASAAAIACVTPAAVRAQGARSARITVSVRPETVSVGQPFLVNVRVEAILAAVIRFPAVPDSGDAIEAIDPRVVTETPGPLLDRTASYRLAAWDLGDRHPALGAVVVTVGGSEERFELQIPPVHVRTLLPSDSADRIAKPPRDPLATPSVLWKLWLLLGALAAVLVGWWWHRRSVTAPPKPEREAYLVASGAFDALQRLALHEAGEPARHVIAHVDVMREYLQRRFPTVHSGLTPSQFVTQLAEQQFPSRHDKLAALLDRDANLRFAATALDAEAASMLAAEAKRIVRDVQDAHEARLRAADVGPQRPRRR